MGTVYDLAEHEDTAGMIWPAGSSVGQKVSAIDVFHDSGSVADQYYFKHSSCSAVTEANQAYGQMFTGGQYFSFLRFGGVLSGYINNAYQWTVSGAQAGQMSSAHNITLDDGSITWTGQMDSISRVNSTGQWIGQRIFALDEYVPFIGGQVTLGDITSIANGQPVGFDPVDLNDAGIVIGNQPNNGGMMIRTPANPPLAAMPDVVLPGIYPVAINDHIRPVAQTAPGASPTPTATPFPAPQILGWDGSAMVVWERQPDSQTWAGFGLEEMIPDMDGWEIWDINDMNDDGVIVGQGSFKDPNNPQAQAEDHAFMLVPVDVQKVWSDQFPGVEANYQASSSVNGFPANGTGWGNKSDIFLGAAQSNNFDGKGHIEAKVKISAGADLRNKILWRLAKQSGAIYAPQTGSSTYIADSDVVTITVDNPAEETDEGNHYHLVAGYDQNGDGQLNASEVSIVPKFKWTHKNPFGQNVSEDRNYEFKIVSASRYNSARESLLSDAWWGTLVTPQASRLLTAFANGAVPQGATSENTTIDRP